MGDFELPACVSWRWAGELRLGLGLLTRERLMMRQLDSNR